MERIVPGEYDWNWDQYQMENNPNDVNTPLLGVPGKPPKPPSHSHKNEMYSQRLNETPGSQAQRPALQNATPPTNQIHPHQSTSNNSISVIDKKGKYTRHRPAPLEIGHPAETPDQRVPSLPAYPDSQPGLFYYRCVI